MKQLFIYLMVLGSCHNYVVAQDNPRPQQPQKTQSSGTISDTVIAFPDGSILRFYTYTYTDQNDGNPISRPFSRVRKGFEETEVEILKQVGEDAHKLNTWMNQQLALRNERIREYWKQQKEALFIDIMGLTPEESKLFWPLYDEFSEKKDAISEKRKEINLAFRKVDLYDVSDKEAEILTKQHIDLVTKETNLQLEYYRKFKAVLSPAKLLMLYKAEDAFKLWMLQSRGQIIE